MNSRRKASELIRLIIVSLKEKPSSLRALDIHLNTSSRTIRDYVDLLAELGIVELNRINKGGRGFTSVSLTEYGASLKIRSPLD